MASGTWNVGRLKKQVEYVGLKDFPTIQFRDTSQSSDSFFNIVEFPNKLTSGKNLIKLQAIAGTLVHGSKIHIEILDSNGDPIYYEPIDYVEEDGTRVISIWIYDDTPPGTATIYIAGRARINPINGATYESSQDINDPNYFNLPNVIWSRPITVAPIERNKTEIIFINAPEASVTEVVVPYQQIVSTPGIVYESASNATVRLTTPGQVVNNSYSQITANNFTFTQDMVGGNLEVVNPILSIGGQYIVNGNNGLLPFSQQNDVGATPFSGFSSQLPLSGSYIFEIVNVINSQTIQVIQTSGFRNVGENTNGAFSVDLAKIQVNAITGTTQVIPETKNSFQATSNFTASYYNPYVTTTSQLSQSFADIVLTDIEPATGDVYKLKLYYKPGGQFGDFIEIGETILEQTEFLIDSSSFEASTANGTDYNRYGFFTSKQDFHDYWDTGSFGVISQEVPLTITYTPASVLNAIELEPDSNFNTTTQRYSYIHLEPNSLPTLLDDTEYILEFKATATSDVISSNTNIPNPRIDIYISGSAGAIEPNAENISAYQLTTNINQTLTGVFADNQQFGMRIGTVENNPGQPLNVTLPFTVNLDTDVDVFFVIRSGKWSIADISLKTLTETGFTPNTVRLNPLIDSEFLNRPIVFKVQYFDYLNRRAAQETIIGPVTFSGGNTVISGQANLMNGQMFVGQQINTGLLLSATNSGLIQSVGYRGFLSASAGYCAPGFLLYSGSIYAGSGDNYSGVGVEMVAESGSSWFKFDTDTGDLQLKPTELDLSNTTIPGQRPIEVKTGDFDLTPADAGKYLIVTPTGTCTIHGVSSSLMTEASEFYFMQSGSIDSGFMFTTGSNEVKLYAKNNSYGINGNFAFVTLKRVSETEFHLYGDTGVI